MKIKNFEHVAYKFRLYDASGQPLVGLPVQLQYFNAANQVWKDIYKGITTQGGIFQFAEDISTTTVAASDFIQNNEIPELRIIPSSPYYGVGKQEVLAQVYQLTINTSSSLLGFDFGTVFIVEKDVLLKYDLLTDFLVITSPIPLVNARATLLQIQSLQASLAASEAAVAQLTSDNSALTAQVNSLTIETQAKDETIASLNTQLISAVSEVEEKNLAITRLQVIKQNLENTISEMQQQIDELSREINFDERPIAVNTLYSNIIREIDLSAQNNTNADYKLANISLKLKTLISSDENGINAQLFGLSTMDQLNGAAISELTFDIAPTATPAGASPLVPNLLGLTETAVRRILDSLGLRLNPVYQNNTSVVNGDSFKQSPAEGSDLNSTDTVTVIFSKHE